MIECPHCGKKCGKTCSSWPNTYQSREQRSTKLEQQLADVTKLKNVFRTKKEEYRKRAQSAEAKLTERDKLLDECEDA